MELAGFCVQLGDSVGVEFTSACCVDEVGEVGQCDIRDCLGDVFEVDVGENFTEGIWKSKSVGGHADRVWLRDADAMVRWLV